MTEVAGKGLGMQGHVNLMFLGPRVVNPHFGDVSKGWAWETRVMGVLPGVVHSSSTPSPAPTCTWRSTSHPYRGPGLLPKGCAGRASSCPFWALRLMDKILHDPKDPKLWELWYIPYYGSCRILSINRISMYLTLRGGETWLPFNTLSPFVTFAPSLIYPDLTTMRRRSSGDWMSTPDDHMGHRGTSLAPGLEMMVSLWSLPAASRPLSIPLLVMAQGPPLAAEHHPLWLVSALEEARHVENHGGCSADMLATLLAVGQSWEVHGYMTFVQEWVDRLAQLLGSTLVDAASRDLGDAGRNWVVYVERSLRKEFLEMVVPDESMEHAVRVSQGEGNTHLLPPVEGATVAAQERRALFNDLQRLTPLLRRLMGEDEPVNPSADRALHRSEWVGTGVQYFYDCHLTGFFTGELLPLLWDAILARGDHDFALAARGYLREVENQVGTFLGQDQAVRPPSSLEWAQGMAEALHLLHHHEGLNVTDRVGRQAVDCSEQRDGTEGGGDETSMVQRDQPKRKWLAPPSRRRRQGPSSRGPNRERDAERSGPERSRGADSQSARCSNERVDLGAMARARAARDRAEPRREVSKPKPKTKSRPKQAIRDAPARSEEARPSERDPPPPLTLEEAVDTWLLVLGIRGIDEGTQDFLPERVVGAIQETFMGFEGVDRLTMALAFTRVVQNLLSSVGRLLEQAVTLPVPSARDPNAAEEVEVEVDEEDDDSSLYMQLGMREPWTQVLRKLQVALEGQPKGTRECNIRRLLSWLDHRVTNYQDGFFLGHVQGNSADLLALLVAYRDAQLEIPPHEDLRSGWCLEWELLLVSYLPLHPGSRGALGLPMLRDPPIMLFSKPMPDSSDSELERATQLLPGSRSGREEKGLTHGPGDEALLDTDAEDRDKCDREPRQREGKRRTRRHSKRRLTRTWWSAGWVPLKHASGRWRWWSSPRGALMLLASAGCCGCPWTMPELPSCLSDYGWRMVWTLRT